MHNRFTVSSNRLLSRRSVLAALAGSAGYACAQSFLPGIPNVGLKGNDDPHRTECGVGALMPWADGLYAVTYNSSGTGGKASGARSGSGLGLYRIDETLKPTMLEEINGVFANRFIHHHSNQCIIGPLHPCAACLRFFASVCRRPTRTGPPEFGRKRRSRCSKQLPGAAPCSRL